MDRDLAVKAELAIGSLADSCRALAEKSGGVKTFAGYTAYFVPETFWYNRVLLQPGAGDDLGVRLEEIAAAAAAGTVPPLLGWMSCDYAPERIQPLLEQAGYAPITIQRAMYLSLEGRAPGPVPENVERVTGAEAVARWADVCCRAFGKPPETEGMKLLAGDDAWDFLQWNENGEAVGTVLLMACGENGGIHEVGTLPEYRKKGVSSALVSRALDIAAERGCRCATLQASELGFPVYKRLGMEHVGDVYTWIRKRD